MSHLPPPENLNHSRIEDILGLILGATLMALAVHLMSTAGLISGQLAGLSLIGSYASTYSFGLIFFVVNLPFYVLAISQMGWLFTCKTFAAIAMVAGLTEVLPFVLQIEQFHPGAAAVITGLLGGTALLVLIRHGASLGGIGILAIFVQERFNIKAGHVQQAADTIIFLTAYLVLPVDIFAWSLLAAVILNIVITLNHRRDRYIAE